MSQSLRLVPPFIFLYKGKEKMDDQKGEVPLPDVPKKDISRNKKPKKKQRQGQYVWAIKVFIASLLTTAILTLITEESINNISMVAAFVLLVIIILINIIFDVVGLAVATAAESPFHSMAARKNRVGKTAVKLLKNADKVSSICNDIVGDIAGIVSGATSVAIAAKIFLGNPRESWFTLLLTSLVAAFTVGGKAFAKKLAIVKSTEIIILTSRFLSFFSLQGRKERNKSKKTKIKHETRK